MKKIEITHTTFSNFIEELKPQFDDAEMISYSSQTYYETEETNGAVLGFSIDLNGTEKTKKGEYERHLYIEFTCIDSTEKCYIKTIDTTYRKIYHFENGKTRFSQKLSIDTQPNELQKRITDIVLFVETIVLAYLKEIDKENEENKTTDELIEEIKNIDISQVFRFENIEIKNKYFMVYLWAMHTSFDYINIQILKDNKTIFYRGDIETQFEFEDYKEKAIKKIKEQVLEEGITILTNDEFEKLYPNWSITNEFNQYDNLPNKHFIILSDNMFVAIDNTDKCCWVEEFKTKGDAIKWLKGND